MPEFAAGFFAGCAGSRIGHLLFATYPRRLTIRESTSARASSSKGENGAGDVLPAPLDQLTRLSHKLINVVVVAVVAGVDVARPTGPACPLPITYRPSNKPATLTPSANRA
jgi:hypothetical protein